MKFNAELLHVLT